MGQFFRQRRNLVIVIACLIVAGVAIGVRYLTTRLPACVPVAALKPDSASSQDAFVPQARIVGCDVNPALALQVGVQTAFINDDGSTVLTNSIDNYQVKLVKYVRSGSAWQPQATFQANGRLTGSALSGDGSTLLLRTVEDASTHVVYHVYTLSDTSMQAQATLSPPLKESTSLIGTDVQLALDDSGSTALIWTVSDQPPRVFIFARSGSAWQQQAELTNKDKGFWINSGATLSGDGNTALIGSSPSQASVFARSGSTWSLQAQLLDQNPESANNLSVALSRDGNTALIGDPSLGNGVAYIYARSGSAWSLNGQLAPERSDEQRFGSSVQLSSDGTTAVVESTQTQSLASVVYIFKRSGDTWQQAARMTAVDQAHPFGNLDTLALSGDGSTLLLGESGFAEYPTLPYPIGIAYVLTRRQ